MATIVFLQSFLTLENRGFSSCGRHAPTGCSPEKPLSLVYIQQETRLDCCTKDASTLIAEEKLEETQSSISHYRAALGALRELPAVHKRQLKRIGLNFKAKFKHPSNVPTTPAEFRRLGLVNGEIMTQILAYCWKHYSLCVSVYNLMWRDFLCPYRQPGVRCPHFLLYFSLKTHSSRLYEGNQNSQKPKLHFAPSNFRKLQRFFSFAANTQAGTTSIQGEWKTMLTYYKTIKRRVDALVSMSEEHALFNHIFGV